MSLSTTGRASQIDCATEDGDVAVDFPGHRQRSTHYDDVAVNRGAFLDDRLAADYGEIARHASPDSRVYCDPARPYPAGRLGRRRCRQRQCQRYQQTEA